ncbi:MAG TPA: hypothetical protein VF021_01000, partial [Longimicrobiales bacterium]
DVVVGAERTEFTPSRGANSIWYQNPWMRGGWADAGHVLGHALGGHGVEWRGFAQGGWPARGVSGEIAGYARKRGRQNLFAPQRQGRSVGGMLSADARVAAPMYIELQADLEHGTGGSSWTTSTARAGLRVRF